MSFAMSASITYFTSDKVSKHGLKFAHLLDIKAPEVFINAVTIT